MPEISKLFVTLGFKSDEFSQGINKADKELRKFGLSFNKIGIAAGAFGGAIIAGLSASVKSWAQAGDEIAKLAKKTGMSAEALSELKYAAELSGASIGSLELAYRSMAKAVTEAGEGTKTYVDALARIGLTTADFIGLKPEDQFIKVALGVANLGDELVMSATAQELFGKSGTSLLPLLAEGADGIQRLREEAHKFGVVFTDESSAAAERFNDNLQRMKAALDGVKYGLAEGLAPALEKVTGIISALISVDKGTAGGLSGILGGIGGGMLGLSGLLMSLKTFGVPGTALMAGGGALAGGLAYMMTQQQMYGYLQNTKPSDAEGMKQYLEVYKAYNAMQGEGGKFLGPAPGIESKTLTSDIRTMEDWTGVEKLQPQRAGQAFVEQAEAWIAQEEARAQALKEQNKALYEAQQAEIERIKKLQEEQDALNKLGQAQMDVINAINEAERVIREQEINRRAQIAMQAGMGIIDTSQYSAGQLPGVNRYISDFFKWITDYSPERGAAPNINVYLDGEQVSGAMDRRQGDALSSRQHMGG